MVRLFNLDEINNLRSFVETRTDNIEDYLTSEEIGLLASRNYRNTIWLVFSDSDLYAQIC